MIEQLNARGRRRGRVARVAVGEHRGQRCQRDAVDILLRIEQLAHVRLVHERRQRPEQQAAVHVFVAVHLVDCRLYGRLGGELVQLVRPDGDAERFGTFTGRALVGQVVGTLAHAHERERGHDLRAAERLDARA